MFTIKMPRIIIIQLRALSSDIPLSQKGVYLFRNPLITFSYLLHVGREKKNMK